MLTLEHVHLSYGGLAVLDDVHLAVPPGALWGIIGPNGAGKTSLFNVISRLADVSSGSVRFQGQDITRMPVHRVAGLGLARTFQNLRVFPQMSLLANVLVGLHRNTHYSLIEAVFMAGRYGRAERLARDRARSLLEGLGLGDLADAPAGSLSYGQQRRLELARALATDPELLLLDEPVAGMHALETGELLEHVRAIHARGHTVLLIEHDMGFVMELCQRVVVLNQGRCIASGTPEEIRANPAVIEAYLGSDAGAA